MKNKIISLGLLLYGLNSVNAQNNLENQITYLDTAQYRSICENSKIKDLKSDLFILKGILDKNKVIYLQPYYDKVNFYYSNYNQNVNECMKFLGDKTKINKKNIYKIEEGVRILKKYLTREGFIEKV